MAFRKYRKYAQSTSPSRQYNHEDPQTRRENNDIGLLIDALTHRILDSGLLDDKFQKNFFLSKDDQKKDINQQKSIVEKKLSSAIKYSRKAQNQGILRMIEEYAKEKGILFDEQVKFQQYDLLEKPQVIQPTVFVTKDRDWLGYIQKIQI